MLAQLVSVALTASVKATDTKSVSSFNHFLVGNLKSDLQALTRYVKIFKCVRTKRSTKIFMQVITSCRTVTPGTNNSVCGVSFHPKDRDVVCIGQFFHQKYRQSTQYIQQFRLTDNKGRF